MRFVLLAVALLSLPVLAAGVEVVDTVPTSAQPLISDGVALLLGLALLGALSSALSAGFNAWLRTLKKKGKKASPFMLLVGAVLNAFALNLDQTARQAQAARQPKEPQ